MTQLTPDSCSEQQFPTISDSINDMLSSIKVQLHEQEGQIERLDSVLSAQDTERNALQAELSALQSDARESQLLALQCQRELEALRAMIDTGRTELAKTTDQNLLYKLILTAGLDKVVPESA